MPRSQCYFAIVLFAVLGKGLVLAVCQASAAPLSHTPSPRAGVLEGGPVTCRRLPLLLYPTWTRIWSAFPSPPPTWALPQTPLASLRRCGPMEAGSKVLTSQGTMQGLSPLSLQSGDGCPLVLALLSGRCSRATAGT